MRSIVHPEIWHRLSRRGLLYLRLSVLALLLLPAAAQADLRRPWLEVSGAGGGLETRPATGFQLEAAPGVLVAGAGRSGPGMRIRPGAAVDIEIQPGAPAFPLAEGSLALWLRPTQALDGESRWIVYSTWAGFDVHLQGSSLLVYATSDARAHLNLGVPAANTWKDRWHLLIVTWKGRQRAVYLDGVLVGARDDVPAMTQAPVRIALGYLPATATTPARGYFVGDLDEFALVPAALTAADVASLYRSAAQDPTLTLLTQFGGALSLALDRRAFLRGESASVRLNVAKSVPVATVHLLAEPDPATGTAAIPLWSGPARTQVVTVDTRLLRPGRYQVYARSDGQAPGQSDSLPLRVLAQRQPDFPLGLDGLVAYPDAMLEKVASWGISFSSTGTYPLEYFGSAVDRLFYHGLGFFPTLNIHHQKVMDLPAAGYFDARGIGTPKLQDEVLQGIVLDGDAGYARFSSSLGSPFSPVARSAMHAYLNRMLDAVGVHPGLIAVAFDDEYTLRLGTDAMSGRRYLGDYGRAARDRFRARTGMTAPFPPNARRGSVFRDDDPYLKWSRIIGLPGDPTTAGLAESWADLSAVVHARRPDIATTTASGGEYGELDAVMDYNYPSIWEPRPHFLIGHGRVDYIFDRHRARQRVAPEKPVWGLVGWWSADLRRQPAWCVEDFRLNTALALAKGARLIDWHTSWPVPTDPKQFGGGLLSRRDLREELMRWSRQIAEEGSMYARLETRRDGRVALLTSETDRAGKVREENQPAQFSWFYPALRIAGYPTDVLSDERVLAGELDRYDALFLADFDYASASLWQKLVRYALTPGKTVYVDAASDLRPPGAVVLPFVHGQRGDPHVNYESAPMPPLEYMAWMGRELCRILPQRLGPPPLRVTGSDRVAPFMLYAPDGRLLTLVNYDLERTQDARLTLIATGPTYIYDVDSGTQVGAATAAGTAIEIQARIARASAARYIVLATPVAAVTGSVSLAGDDFLVQAAVTGPDGRAIRFPFPLEVSLTDPQGRPVAAYLRHTAVDPGTGRLLWRFPRSRVMDPAGSWRVSVKELTTSRTSAAGGTVADGS